MSYDDDDDDDSHILGSRLSLLSARPAVTLPSRRRSVERAEMT